MKHERQTLIPGWDQTVFRDASAIIVGCGALGSALGHSLARLGIGHIMLVDPDRIEEHNLENQAYDESDLGKLKVIALKERLTAIDPTLIVECFWSPIQDVYHASAPKYVFGCLDNVAGRHYVNFVAVRDSKVLIDGGMEGFRGQVKTIVPGQTACQACLPTLPAIAKKASCSSAPVPSTYVTANVVANLQATQLVKILRREPFASYVQVDMGRSAMHTAHLQPRRDCELCGPAFFGVNLNGEAQPANG